MGTWAPDQMVVQRCFDPGEYIPATHLVNDSHDPIEQVMGASSGDSHLVVNSNTGDPFPPNADTVQTANGSQIISPDNVTVD